MKEFKVIAIDSKEIIKKKKQDKFISGTNQDLNPVQIKIKEMTKEGWNVLSVASDECITNMAGYMLLTFYRENA